MDALIRRQEHIFSRAVALPAGDRDAFLRSACGEDDALLRSVRELLEADSGAGEFLLPRDWTWMPAEPAPPDGLPDNGSWVGNYKVIRRLGQGGCGVVFEAEQVQPLRRRVALKILRPGMASGEVIARFEAERQALAMMDHPGIARVFDAGATPAGLPFFVMELIRGTPVARYCDERTLGIARRVELVVTICHAVQHAHEKGVVHRDLKPSNILVSEYDGAPVPRIIDFGIAKAMQAPLASDPMRTGLTQVIGTPAYMSPEQLHPGSAEVDERTDVHALGVLLHELLVGETPVAAGSLASLSLEEVRRLLCEQHAIAPSAHFASMCATSRQAHARARATTEDRLLDELRGGLDGVILRCLRERREERYPTVGRLADDLRMYLRGEVPAIGAHEPSDGRATTRTAGRGRAAGGESVAVLPFAVASRSANHAILAGIHEDIITHLAKIHGLRVIAPRSVAGLGGGAWDLQALAGRLGVAYVLEGSVRETRRRVRISARLTAARTLQVDWSETYERDMADVFAVQSAVAREIAETLHITLTARESSLIGRAPTQNQAAYAAFLRGRALAARTYNRQDVTGAVAALEEAVSLDPEFALAWAQLSMAHGAMYWFTFLDPTPERLAQCKAAADEALRLQPRLPEVHLMLGMYQYLGFRNWERAWSELQEAYESMPGDAEVLCARGLTLRRMGRWTESTEAFEAAVACDPHNGVARLGLADNHGFHRRFAEALHATELVIAYAPDYRLARRHICWYRFALSGDREGLLAELGGLAGEPDASVPERVELALLRERPGEALSILAATAQPAFRDHKRELARADLQAQACYFAGDFARAAEFAAEAADFYGRSVLQREPESVFTTIALARALALQGRMQDALATGRRAMAMLPPSRDALWGPEIIGEFAAVCLFAGQVDEALAHLDAMLRQPWDASAHEFRIDPLWRRLAGNARFEWILAATAPA